MKMAGISAKAFSALNNPYQYQGDYSEFDETTGWNDFYLRSYDAQTGRFNGADPYDQFASPYTGMGNDPVNNIDPSGGFSLLPVIADLGSDFLNAAGNVAVSTAIGYGIGYLAAGKEGAKWGAGIGFGLSVGSYVPWEGVGNVGKWVGNLFSGSEWLDLTKNVLMQLANQIFTSEGAKQNYLGNMFENNWHVWAQMHFTLLLRRVSFHLPRRSLGA